MTKALPLTPPRGWNSWNRYLGPDHRAQIAMVTEDDIISQGRALVESGLKDAGYRYLVLDDCYQGKRRDHRGRIQTHPNRFPSGIKALADEIHSMGLSFGLYSVPGSLTCAQQYDDYVGDDLGSLNRERIDAESFAEWGVDFLKYDWCRAHINDGLEAEASFQKMADEISQVNREIVYSISEYGLFKPHNWAPKFANMWRTTNDLIATWDSILRTLDQQVGLEKFSQPGAWNDPDMLQVGNGQLTEGENRAHFYLWALLNAPLMAGMDLTKLSDEVRVLLTNKAVLAINDDFAGEQGKRIYREGEVEIWGKRLSDGSFAAVFLNRGAESAKLRLSQVALGFESQLITDVPTQSRAELEFGGILELPPHDARLLSFS